MNKDYKLIPYSIFLEDSFMATQNTSIDNQPLVISTTEPAKFKSIGDSSWVDSIELGECVNAVFSPIFPDYFGCKIFVERSSYQTPLVTANLIFSALPEDQSDDSKHRAFQPITVNAAGQKVTSIDRLVSALNGNSNPGFKVNLTEYGKKLIDGYSIKSNKFNGDYTQCYETYIINNQGYIELHNLNVIKLLEIIYGSKDEDDNDFIYQISPVCPKNINDPSVWGEYKSSKPWILNIVRINESNNENAARLLHMVNDNNNILASIIRK